MNKRSFQLGILFFVLFLTLASSVQAQGTSPQSTSAYSLAQLDQMLAPVALYPDPLIGDILMAATYPLEVVEAARWLQVPANAALSGVPLANALQSQSWDPSVKSLTAFPQVVRMMDSNIQWTEQLGDAFLGQQPAVMDTIQHLRQQAQAAGNLASTPQQVVSTQDSEIVIEPENPQIVYVPVYDPAVVYGAWDYPAYPPYNFYPLDYAWGGVFFGFGVGMLVAEDLWGWNRWDWGHHRMNIDDRRFGNLNHGFAPHSSGTWQHDPAHRLGVPYHDAASQTHYQGAVSSDTRRATRGYSPAIVPSPVRSHATQSSVRPEMSPTNRAAPSEQRRVSAPRSTPAYQRSPVAAPMQRSAPPVYESFSRGTETRAQSSRGFTSRSSSPPVGSSHNGGGGGGGNRDGDNKRR